MTFNKPNSGGEVRLSEFHTKRSEPQGKLRESIEDCAKRLIIENPLFQGRDLRLCIEVIDDVLVVCGRASSFYFKADGANRSSSSRWSSANRKSNSRRFTCGLEQH
jgi:hypothetical protein